MVIFLIHMILSSKFTSKFNLFWQIRFNFPLFMCFKSSWTFFSGVSYLANGHDENEAMCRALSSAGTSC